MQAEKVHTLIPEAYRTLANADDYIFNLGTQRSTFNVQLDSQEGSKSQAGVKYDQKNKLWRTTQSLAKTGKSDDIAKDNRDPWVYQFSSDVIKDLKYDDTRATPKPAALCQKGDVACNPYIAENVHDFTRNYTTPISIFPRSAAAPATAEVANWPTTWSVAQTESDLKELPLKYYADDMLRSNSPPTKADVKNWPFPQFAQAQSKTKTLPKNGWDPLNKEYGLPDTFPRNSPAPKEAMVSNWPFPQYAQKKEPSPDYDLDERFPRPATPPTRPQVLNWPTQKEIAIFAQKEENDEAKEENYGIDERFDRPVTAPSKAEVKGWPFSVAQKQEPSEDYGIGETFPRSAAAPKSAEVANWPYPQYAQNVNENNNNDIADVKHVDPNVYGFVNDHTSPVNEVPRSAEAPKSAEVKNWPYPQYAQNVDEQNSEVEDIARNKYVNKNVYDFVNDVMPDQREVSRTRSAPSSADVRNWPYPQYAQSEDVAANKWINRKVHGMASQYVDADNHEGRRASAPTSSEVRNWPYPQYAQAGDVAANKYINQKVHGMASDMIRSIDTNDRRASAPT